MGAEYMTEATKLTMVKEYWKHADAGLSDEFAAMQTGFAFYAGNQWSADDLAKLQREGRPALTINLILPIINLLSGIQRQGRQDVSVVARKGGLKPLASVFTQVLRHCLDITEADYELADMFTDGIIGGKGWLKMSIDYTDDPIHGDIALKKVSPFSVREDPDAREYDLNRSGKFVIADEWMDKEALLLNFPDKRADIEAGGLNIDTASGDVIGEGDAARWRVRECWWKSFENRLVLIDTVTGTMKSVGADTRIARAIAAASDRWAVKEWVVAVLNKTVTAGNLVLEDISNPFGESAQFPLYRFCPMWVDGGAMGVIENMIGPQQEVNKRRSQALHNLNQAANSGFKVKKALNNYDKYIAKFGSKPGIVLDESKAGGSIERIEPAPLSAGHIQAASLSADDMKEISGANPDLMGQFIENYSESGKAIELRQAQGMKVVEVMFDNFSRTQKLIANGLVDMVRFAGVYSDSEIRQIASEENVNVDISLMKNKRFGMYGIKVKSSSSSPTAQYADFMSILEIAKMYPEQIPPEVVIENSNIANKEIIASKVVNSGARIETARPKKGATAGLKLKPTKDFVNTIYGDTQTGGV
jgi:hypothetical protein